MCSRRVAITGYGIWSSLGNSYKDCLKSLYYGISGVKFCEEYEKAKLPSQVRGKLEDPKRAREFLKKKLRYASLGTLYSVEAFLDAVKMAKLSPEAIRKAGVNIGTGGSFPLEAAKVDKVLREKGVKRISTGSNLKVLPNNPNIVLATMFGMQGGNYGCTAACATAANCIGDAFMRIKLGINDLVFAGGCDEQDALIASTFCALRSLSTHFNTTSEKASRPYDAKRDGFVMSGGAGTVVLEDMDHAIQRGAPILGEIIGYAFNSDGGHITSPSGEGAENCMIKSLEVAGISPSEIGYINTHGTSTQNGDLAEAKAVKNVFGTNCPPISSTKSLSGHGLGASGAQEIIYSLIMMQNDFISASSNIEKIDPEIEKIGLSDCILTKRLDNFSFNTFMSNSFGFGGSNAVLIVRKVN